MIPVINPGSQLNVITDSPPAAGSRSETFTIQGDSVLLTLSCTSISGTLSVVAYSVINGLRSDAIIEFADVTSPTSTLLVEKSAGIPNQVEVVATYTGACEYQIQARSLFFSGDSNGSGDDDDVVGGRANGEDVIFRDILSVYGTLHVTGMGRLAVLTSFTQLRHSTLQASSTLDVT